MISRLRNVALKREFIYLQTVQSFVLLAYLGLDMVVQPGNVSHDRDETKEWHEFKTSLCYGIRLCLKK